MQKASPAGMLPTLPRGPMLALLPTRPAPCQHCSGLSPAPMPGDGLPVSGALGCDHGRVSVAPQGGRGWPPLPLNFFAIWRHYACASSSCLLPTYPGSSFPNGCSSFSRTCKAATIMREINTEPLHKLWRILSVTAPRDKCALDRLRGSPTKRRVLSHPFMSCLRINLERMVLNL